MIIKKTARINAVETITVNGELVNPREDLDVDITNESNTGLNLQIKYNFNPKLKVVHTAFRKDHFAIGRGFPEIGESVDIYTGHGCKPEISQVIFTVEHTQDGDLLIFQSEGDKNKLEEILMPEYLVHKPKSCFSFERRAGAMAYYAYARNKAQDTLENTKGGIVDGSTFKTDWMLVDLKKLSSYLFNEEVEEVVLPPFVIEDDEDDNFWILSDSSDLQKMAVKIDEHGEIIKVVENYEAAAYALN